MTSWSLLLAKHMHLTLKEINELPLYKLFLFVHAILVSEGAATRWKYSDISCARKVTMDDVNSLINEL